MDSSAPSPDSIPDALRVAAAAVANQQAVLDEQEARLREREEQLARQEQQVAERLSEKQQQIEELQRQLAVAREQFRGEREQIEELREEAASAHREASAERDRLLELRPKFIRRLKRHWVVERKDIEHRQAELARLRHNVDHDSARLAAERAAFERERQESHRNAEEQRQRLRDESRAVAEAHGRFAAERRTGLLELVQREHQMAEQVKAIEELSRRAEVTRAELDKRCEDLRAEARGLEQRVSSARRLLAEATAHAPANPPAVDMTHTETTALATLLAEVPDADRARLADYYERCRGIVRAQAARLADQRAHLVELYERLTGTEHRWERQQTEAVEDMERLCGELQAREEALRARSREVEAAAERQRQERDRVARLRAAAERSAAELATRQSAWHGERERLRIELDERLNAVATREESIATLFRRWRERRQAEVDQLRDLKREAAQARDTWARERDEFQRRSESLRIAQQALVEQALALEESRREFLKETERPDLAAKRIERLHRRWEGLAAASQRELRSYRERLVEEDAELRQIHSELERQQEQLCRGERDLAQRLTELEQERRRVAIAVNETDVARRTWEQQRQQYEQQLADTRTETERLANQLAGDDSAPALRSAA